MNDESKSEDVTQTWILAVSAALLCALQIVVLVPNHDNAWLIELSARMLDGGRYYKDFYELNPPLYPILLLPVDLLSRASGIAPYPLFVVYVCALLYFVSRKLSTCLPIVVPDITPRARMLLALYMQICLFLLPAYDFGQRDHVAICLVLPLLCYLITEQSNGRVMHQAVMAAVCAALGILIKPFLAGVVVLLLAVRIAATRRVLDLLWPIVVPAAAVAACYLLLVVTVFQEWLMMARIAGAAYSKYAVQQLLPAWTLSALALMAGLAIANEYLERSAAARLAVRYFIAATLGALLSYVLQHKGFSYHLAPVKIMVGLSLALVGLAWLQRPRHELSWAPVAFLAGLLLLGCGEEARSLRRQEQAVDSYRQLAATLSDLHAGHRLFFFSTSLTPEFALQRYYSFVPSSRFPCLWTLPEAIASGRDGQLTDLVAEDFRRWQPTAFLVDESPHKQALSQPFEFLPWFERDPQLRELLDQYQLAGRYADLAIYIRKAPAGS